MNHLLQVDQVEITVEELEGTKKGKNEGNGLESGRHLRQRCFRLGRQATEPVAKKENELPAISSITNNCLLCAPLDYFSSALM